MPRERRKDNRKDSPGMLFNFSRDSYLERTSRPVYALWFLLPFIVVYELGTILLNTETLEQVLVQGQGRVTAFVWVQRLLGHLGFGERLAWVAPPVVVILILIGWQVASRKPWHFAAKDTGPMAVESILLAIPLIVLCLFFNSRASPAPGDAATSQASVKINDVAVGVRTQRVGLLQDVEIPSGGDSLWARMVIGIGAGVYEELVFRLILICLLMMIFQDLLGISHLNAIILSIMISAGLFSAYHHVDFVGGQFRQTSPFNWTEFLFRTMAGIYFAVLFAVRGFGIAVGTHAFYDIMATAVNATFYQS